MKNRIQFILKAAVLLVLISSNSIFSQETPRYSDKQLDSIEYARATKKFPKFKFYVYSGGLFSVVDGSITVNNKLLGLGTKLDFDDNLKLPKDITTYTIGGYYNLGDKSTFSMYFLEMNQKSNLQLKDSVQFGDYKFNGNANFDFKLNISWFGFNYCYNIVSKPQIISGASVGIRLFNIKTVGSGSVTSNNETTQKSSENSMLAPGLLLGLSNKVFFLPKLLNRTSLEYFGIKVGTVRAELFEARLAFEYYFFKNLGLGLLGMANILKVRSDSQEKFNGEVDYTFKGLSFYLIARF
jgi:hypothetical protein